MKQYLESTEYIDWENDQVTEVAENLAIGLVSDAIRHTSDFRVDIITAKASDVLLHKTGYCYAKSHLLAALLRANKIPAGLCYQRLSQTGQGGPYCLHGLNAVYLNRYGWYRVDARGNKKGVNADFIPPIEQLAWPIGDSFDEGSLSPVDSAEFDIQGIWAEPLAPVLSVLQSYNSYIDVDNNLPDIDRF